MKCKIRDVRLAFANVHEPKAGPNGGDEAFSASFLFPPEHPAKKTVQETIREVAHEKWGERADTVLKSLKADNKLCLRSGDSKAEYEGFPGNLFVSARNKVRPKVVAQDGETPLVAADGKPYSGCYVMAVLDIWAQDNAYGKRINAGLMGVQFLRDGDAFTGGGVASDDDFEDMSDGASAGDMEGEGDGGDDLDF